MTMSARFQIKDNAGNLLTLQIKDDWTDWDGTWMPDDFTKVRSGTDWDSNPMVASGHADGSSPYPPFMIIDGVLKTVNNDQTIRVMKMNDIYATIGFKDAGDGELFSAGVMGTFQAGAMTWKKL
jgi:hypothetical protein